MSGLERMNIEIKDQKTIEKGQEYELKVSAPSAVGTQNYLVKVLDFHKKKVSAKDIYKLGMEAISRKTPVIVISSTGFAKTAVKKWKEELKDFMILMTEDDLEMSE